jgi:hypothetical protein
VLGCEGQSGCLFEYIEQTGSGQASIASATTKSPEARFAEVGVYDGARVLNGVSMRKPNVIV